MGSTALAAFCAATWMVPSRAPAGTVAEQRARLPPPATCTDDIAGTWKSHDYRAAWGQWTIFTLQIERVNGTNELKGTIVNESWRADETKSEPGICEGELHYKVSMDGVGRVADGNIQFGGVGQWRLDEVLCGDLFGGYNLDNFTGLLDLELLEFQSVNNDGGRSVNEPTVFRRVECAEETKQQNPKIVVKPPAFYPPEEDSTGAAGCMVR